MQTWQAPARMEPAIEEEEEGEVTTILSKRFETTTETLRLDENFAMKV